MPNLAKKVDCCGCSACYSVCNFAAIQMRPDQTGFLYPAVDYFKCRECGKCELVCPVLNLNNKSSDNSIQPKAFVAQHRDEVILKQSTSGGAFTAIAEMIISLGGFVFGASFDKDFVVKHTSTDSFEGLAKFRNSKYVQSEIANTFIECKKFLDDDRWVCFSGTPCQIYGLLGFLNKEYEKLITVEVVCLGVPSPKLFSKYLSFRARTIPSIDSVIFRDKARGYSYPTMFIKGKKWGKNKYYRCGSEADEWLRLFLKGYSIRSVCRKCIFQSSSRNCDFTIWDCNNIGSEYKKIHKNGITNIIIWSRKGEQIFEKLQQQLRIYTVDIDISLSHIKRKPKHFDRCPELFFSDLDTLTPEQFFSKYSPRTMKIKIITSLRSLSYYMGFYRLARMVIQARRNWQ